MEFNGPSGPLGIALALLVGLGALGYGAYSYTQQSAALDSAVTTEATVVDTSVETVNQRRGVGYAPQVTFDYSFEGSSYTSSNVYPGPLTRDFDTESAAREVISAYEPNTTATAYVPPSTPNGAFLEHESSNGPFLLMGIGSLFLVFGVRAVLKGDL